MVRLKIIWTQFAGSELKNIYQYYKQNASINVAKKIKKRILVSVKQLQNHPQIGQIEENLTDQHMNIVIW